MWLVYANKVHVNGCFRILVILFLTCTPLQAKTGSGEVDLAFQTSLTSFATTSHVVTLVPSSPAVRMSLGGQLAYKDVMATNKRLFFDANISTSDFIRYMYMYIQVFFFTVTCTSRGLVLAKIRTAH